VKPALLFDLDRTLIDVQSFTDYAAALAEVEALIGDWADPPTPPTGWDGPTRRCMGVLVALTGDHRWEAVSRLIEGHEMAAALRSRPMPSLVAALERVEGLPCAVVTLLPDAVARVALRLHRVPIETVIPRRADRSPKPAPDQLLAACTRLGVLAPEAVMIGDSSWDEQAAVAAGCRFVGVTNGTSSEFAAGTPIAVDLLEAVELAIGM
jgi:phosphoglycolate phosphatase-like HAD superfamily hydrolase